MCESPFHTVTSGLQSVSVLQYQNGSVRISCVFASGSLATGCEVSLSLDTFITVVIEVSRCVCVCVCMYMPQYMYVFFVCTIITRK